MRKTCVICGLLLLCVGARWTWAEPSGWADQRKAAINRKRAVMYYNGGEEPLFWKKDEPFSVDAFLNERIAPLKESKVDSIFYAPISAFAFLSVKIPSADLVLHQPEGSKWMAGNANVMKAFIDQNTDPLRAVITWCKANQKEVFATLCPNTVHHGTEYDFSKPPPPYNWDNYLFPPFKVKNRTLLVGTPDKKPPFGNWSSVDYGETLVRDTFFQNARDICAGYDVDGLCLDFMRDPLLFKSVAWGEKASLKERKSLTDLVRRIRAAAEESGQKRGRPILLTVRVPDSVPYCADIGIELDVWMKEKLVDFVIAGGSFQLNPWTQMAAACKKNGTKFYASLDESGIWIGNDSGGWVDDERMPRQCPETYRARIADALVGGADGVFFANRYDEDWRRHEIRNYKNWICGEWEDIKMKSKRYFVTYRPVGHAGRFLKEWSRYATLAELSTHRPAQLKTGSVEYPLYVWDNLGELKSAGQNPSLLLLTQVITPTGTEFEIMLNGKKLELLKKQADCQRFKVPPECVKYGLNKVRLNSKGRSKNGLVVEVRNVALDVVFN